MVLRNLRLTYWKGKRKVLNKVILIGRLTKDVEVNKTNSGKTVTEFSVAVNRDKDHADFIRVQAWEKVAEFLGQYAKKGMLIAVDGKLRCDSYEKNGYTQYKTYVLGSNIRLLEKAQKNANSEQNATDEYLYPNVEDNDEMPF